MVPGILRALVHRSAAAWSWRREVRGVRAVSAAQVGEEKEPERAEAIVDREDNAASAAPSVTGGDADPASKPPPYIYTSTGRLPL
jgi:hypothetical protein